MKITLDVPDHKAAFILEMLQAFSYVKAEVATPRKEPVEALEAGAEPDETTYLLSTPANAKALQEALDRFNRGQMEQHDLLEV